MKIVISGSGSCGKTAVINELKNRGYKTISDTAREVLQQRKYHLPLRIESEFREKTIIERQIKKESEIKSNEVVFLDYGLVDAKIYVKFLLNTSSIIIPEKLLKSYDQVFLLDRLPWIKDGIRVEANQEQAIKIHNMIEAEYKNLGYSVIKVPAMPVNQRVDFILNNFRLYYS